MPRLSSVFAAKWRRRWTRLATSSLRGSVDQTMSPMESTSSRAALPISCRMRTGGSPLPLRWPEFAQDRDLRKPGSHVVVEVARHPRSHALEREGVPEPAAVQREGDGAEQERRRGKRLGPPPERGADAEVDDGLGGSDQTAARDAADAKAIAPGGQARVDDGGLGGRRAPVAVDSVHAVLVSRPASRREVQRDESHLDRRRLDGAPRDVRPLRRRSRAAAPRGR